MAEVHNFTCPSGFEPEKAKQDDQSQISADLDEEDEENIELWMIKAPLNFDISLLSGRELEEQFNIPSEEKSDIEFVGKATANHPTCKAFQTVFPHKTKNKLKIGPSFKGYVDIVQSMKIHNNDHVDFPQEKPCKIPFNLKQRYIPYGSNSPAKISSTSKIKEKSKKRKRHSESLSFSIPDLDTSQVNQAGLENPPSKKRKKHKEKKKEFSEFSLKSVDVMDNSCLMPQTPVPFSMIDLEESSLKKQKHKEKKELNKSVTSVDMRDNNGSSMLQTPVSISMTDLDASQSNPIDLKESSSKKKKKKHKEKKEFSETRLSVDMIEDSFFMPQTPVSFSIPALDTSQVNQAELENPPSKKRKKHKEKKKEFSEFSLKSVDVMDNSCLMPQTPVLFSMADLEESSLKKQKHKKKKELNKSVTSVDMRDNNGSSMLQTPVSISMTDLDASQSNPIDLKESSSKKKKKKHKEKKEFSETRLSVDMIEDSFFMPQTPVSFSMADLEESSSKKQKHKEKKELNKSVTSVDMRDNNGSSMLQTPVSISMTDLDASQSNPIDLQESSSKKKKKKHKEKKEFSETRLSVDMMEDSCFMPQTPVPFSMADLEESFLKKQKHKEKKELNKSVTSVDMRDNNGSSMLQTPVSISMTDLDASQSNPIDLQESSSKKKKKKHKEKKEFSETRLSVDMMEDSCFIPQTPEVTVPESFYIDAHEEFLTMSSKKKKKHKDEKVENADFNNVEMKNRCDGTSQNADMDSSSRKRKKQLPSEACADDANRSMNGISVDIHAQQLLKKDIESIGSLEMEFDHLNSIDFVPELEESFSSSHKKKKKKHKKHSFEENSLNETYSQLNIKRGDENKIIDNNPHPPVNNSWNDSTNLDSSSKKKKRKTGNLFGTSEDSVPLVNGSPIYTEESVKEDGRINSLQMELGILNSVDSVHEKVSLHKKKKKHKKMTCLDNS